MDVLFKIIKLFEFRIGPFELHFSASSPKLRIMLLPVWRPLALLIMQPNWASLFPVPPWLAFDFGPSARLAVRARGEKEK